MTFARGAKQCSKDNLAFEEVRTGLTFVIDFPDNAPPHPSRSTSYYCFSKLYSYMSEKSPQFISIFHDLLYNVCLNLLFLHLMYTV